MTPVTPPSRRFHASPQGTRMTVSMGTGEYRASSLLMLCLSSNTRRVDWLEQLPIRTHFPSHYATLPHKLRYFQHKEYLAVRRNSKNRKKLCSKEKCEEFMQ